jgi:hypothetical protein
MKRILLNFLVCIAGIFPVQSQNIIPDIVHYTIQVDDINYSAKTISGVTTLRYTTDSTTFSQLNLSLLKLTIDSIQQNGASLVYTYNDTAIGITLPVPVAVGDTQEVAVYYHGAPKMDPSGWGGFYFSSTYAFNLGVGFDSDPHVFGRAWFPCNDVFTDRASYSFLINTATGYKAFCNGILTGSTPQPGGKIQWQWEFTQEIPTYLASMAVAPYYTWQRNYQNIPVEIACLPVDSNNVTGSFIHLDSVISHYIDAYGPYRYDKVGYCLIPFSSGAMEHASSIHIGKPFIDGSLNNETLWIHELAHMWWGDWVTCETAGDMWLNEGFASFNEAYISEQLYGTTAYRDWFRSNHRRVLQFAHITDNGYLPLINIPHAHTYGPTVYNKGADVAHTLRYYMDDAQFFDGCKAYMNNRGNGNANSYQFRDDLTTSSGIDMTRFFDDWVFTSGFPHFSIDSVVMVPGGLNHYFIYTRQKSKGNSHLYNMQVEITLADQFEDTTVTVTIDSLTNVFHIATPNAPTWISIDRYDHMADAITDYERVITATGAYTMPETNVQLNVQTLGTDTSTVRIEHHWVAPDPFKNTGSGIRVSDYHYWSADGFFEPGFRTKATFTYNGSFSTATGYIDNTFITGTEDSLVLLYRPNAAYEWEIQTGVTLSTGNKFDKIGTITTDTLKIGEYSLGYRDYTTGYYAPGEELKSKLNIWPNPTHDTVNLQFTGAEKSKNYLLSIVDVNGKVIINRTIQSGELQNWKPIKQSNGTYFVRIFDQQTEVANGKFQLVK